MYPMTVKQLADLVSSYPVELLSPYMKTSVKDIKLECDRFGITLPTANYWNKNPATENKRAYRKSLDMPDALTRFDYDEFDHKQDPWLRKVIEKKRAKDVEQGRIFEREMQELDILYNHFENWQKSKKVLEFLKEVENKLRSGRWPPTDPIWESLKEKRALAQKIDPFNRSIGAILKTR